VQASASSFTNSESLFLACEGGKTLQVATSTSSASAIDSGGGTAVASGVTTEGQLTKGAVLFRMTNGAAEMNIPPQFLNGARQGNGGWFKAKNLKVSDEGIWGKVQIGLLSASTFRIDRLTGQMTTEGGFSGNCKPVDPSAKKF
jgi:hypothetical protein